MAGLTIVEIIAWLIEKVGIVGGIVCVLIGIYLGIITRKIEEEEQD